MVIGVNGDLDHVVRHVVVEYRTTLECVTTLSLHVEGKNVMDLLFILPRKIAMTFVVQVAIVCIHV